MNCWSAESWVQALPQGAGAIVPWEVISEARHPASVPGKQRSCIQVNTAHYCLKCRVSKTSKQTTLKQERACFPLEFARPDRSLKKKRKKGLCAQIRSLKCIDTTCKRIFLKLIWIFSEIKKWQTLNYSQLECSYSTWEWLETPT